MKMMVKVLLTAAAIAAFAAPAMAAGTNKLIVRNAGDTADVFKVTDDGTISTAGFYYDGATALTGFGTIIPTGALSITAQSSAGTRGLVNSQHTTNAAGANASFRKSRGTEALPTIVANGDYTGSFAFRNYDGATWLATAFFGARISGTVAAGSVPTDIYFCSAAGGTSDCYGTGNVKLLVAASGNVGVGTVTPTSKLQVVGLPTYADNTAALAGGLTAGAFYRTATGVLMVAY